MIAIILLQATGAGSPLPNILLMGGIFLVVYFFMLRPQQKKMKDQKNYINELKKGDKVVTTSGIHGKIVDIAETTFLIEIDNGVKVRFEKSHVSLDASKALNAPAPVTKSKA